MYLIMYFGQFFAHNFVVYENAILMYRQAYTWSGAGSRGIIFFLLFFIDITYLMNSIYITIYFAEILHTSSMSMTVQYSYVVRHIPNLGLIFFVSFFYDISNKFIICLYISLSILLKFCKQAHCSWQCNIHVVSEPHLIRDMIQRRNSFFHFSLKSH